MNRRMLRGHDILCLSSIDWQFIWQGHQEIMSTLAAYGNRVLFVENTGVRRPALRDLSRVRDRFRNWLRGTQGFRQERENLYVFSPLVLPFPYSALARRINRFLLLRYLRRWMVATEFGRPLVWTFLPTPLACDIIREIDPSLTVYYCIDDLASSSSAARRIERSEEQLFREADLVFVTSEKLRKRAAAHSERVHVFPFGVSFLKFERARASAAKPPSDIEALSRPIVGFVGGIHRWIDFSLLADVAGLLPETNFVLVGPPQVDTSSIASLPNVHLLGSRQHDELPAYIRTFDVGIVPYRLSEYTANVYPTKLNEYLAMGKPVVATDLQEIRRFNRTHGDIVAVATGAKEFAAAIERELKEHSDIVQEHRIDVARENSWEIRIERMSDVIETSLNAKTVSVERWQQRLRLLSRRARRRIAAVILIVAVAYLATFETNVAWMLAEPLRISAAPMAADAIVVFAGGVGESGQAGGGYQERVKMAVDLYKMGYAPRLIFSSGYTFVFREVEVMFDLAVAQGVPVSAILLETKAASTYENVTFVQLMLEREGWGRILLVSSPYHMRRAVLTWATQASEVDVVPTPVPESQFYAHARGATIEQVRGIIREYAAIGWYWWRGWI